MFKQSSFDEVIQAVPYLIKFPASRFWVDHDKEADVLYLSFRKPPRNMGPQANRRGKVTFEEFLTWGDEEM